MQCAVLPLLRAESAAVSAVGMDASASARSSGRNSFRDGQWFDRKDGQPRRANSDSAVTFAHGLDTWDEKSGEKGLRPIQHGAMSDVDAGGEASAPPGRRASISRGNSDGKMLSKDSRREGLIAGMRRLFLGMGSSGKIQAGQRPSSAWARGVSVQSAASGR